MYVYIVNYFENFVLFKNKQIVKNHKQTHTKELEGRNLSSSIDMRQIRRVLEASLSLQELSALLLRLLFTNTITWFVCTSGRGDRSGNGVH